MEQRFFAAYHQDHQVWKKSSSGGAFTAITDAWFSVYGDKAVVYGCVLDEALNAKHVRATTLKERDLMRGSKYIASNIGGIFLDVKKDLSEGNYVVFSGTPCQVSALKAYLLKEESFLEERLLTIDVICHGVGEPQFFKDYIAHLEKRYKSKAISCNFRAKHRPGKISDIAICFTNGKKYNAATAKYDWFYSVYSKNYILKDVCFSCKYANLERLADISLGDDWGYSALSVKNKARTLILVNSQIGLHWVEKALQSMDYTERETPQKKNFPNLYAPSPKPTDYERFWEIYRKEGYLAAQRYIGNNTAKGKIKSFIALILYKLHLIEAIKWIKETLK